MDLLAGDAFGVAGRQHGRACDVAALLADRLRAAQDDVVNQGCIEPGATGKGREDLSGELYGRDFVESSRRDGLGRGVFSRGRR